ncbi:MAG TPA: DnaJ domain-containing protein [Candidatus Angelobacter sp.]
MTASSNERPGKMEAQAKRDYYEVLGVARTASEQDIRQAFQARAAEFHAKRKPQTLSDVEEMRAIATAYRVLRDADKRRRYDQFGYPGIGDPNNKLASDGPDKLDEALKRFEEIYENWGSSVDASFWRVIHGDTGKTRLLIWTNWSSERIPTAMVGPIVIHHWQDS